MSRPYSICTPDFEVTSGGIRVMWGLYGWLLSKGQIAFINAQYKDPNFVAIYPEIMQGNPMGASKVVRYILNKPGVMASNGIPGPTKFDPGDTLYYFSRLFGDAPNDHYMFLPIINTHVFKDQQKTRSKTAYFIGKGTPTEFVHPKDSLLIDRQVASDQQYLADLLNECSVLYCYDPVTAMTEIARLCGVRVVMLNTVYTKDQFKKYEAGMNGISWGVNENVPLDTRGFRRHYNMMRGHFSSRLDTFIEETQK